MENNYEKTTTFIHFLSLYPQESRYNGLFRLSPGAASTLSFAQGGAGSQTASKFDRFGKARQDFILETKRIEFPDFPDAFNPSIIRWQGHLLMSFRCYHPTNGSTNPFALVWLDDDFNPVSDPQVFELPFHNPVLPSKQQIPD